jgi:hypothetical protein
MANLAFTQGAVLTKKTFTKEQCLMMDLPKEFFTIQSMLTLTGATGATFVIANGCQRAFNFNPRWLALAIAQVISIAGVLTIGKGPADLFVGIVNGFLIYCTTLGATSMVGSPPPEAASARGAGAAPNRQDPTTRRRFLTRWF